MTRSSIAPTAGARKERWPRDPRVKDSAEYALLVTGPEEFSLTRDGQVVCGLAGSVHAIRVLNWCVANDAAVATALTSFDSHLALAERLNNGDLT